METPLLLSALLLLLLPFPWLLRPSLTQPSPASPHSTGIGDKLPPPKFSVAWIDDKSVCLAGDTATIKVKPWGNSPDDGNAASDDYVAEFSLAVGGKKGNSSYVSSVCSYSEGDPAYWNITFVPIMVGEFTAVVTEERSGVADSSLHFSVLPGCIHVSACIASWMNNVNEFVAGTKANVLILPNDAFGNNISSSAEVMDYYCNFTLAAYHENGSAADILEVKHTGWDGFGFAGIEFTPSTAGSFMLYVLGENVTLRGSPLPFKVKPGALLVNKCLGKWKYETNALQIFSRLEFFIYQHDQFGNLVPDFYRFDARVIKKETNLSIPVADILFSETEPGIQLLSFIVTEPGDFILVVFDGDRNESISNTPHDYTVFVGYCHGSNSVVNGSGIVASVAGQLAYFTVYLEDMYRNPSPVEIERLNIQISRKNDSLYVKSTKFPLRNSDDGEGPAPASHFNRHKTSASQSAVQTSAFNVAYTPEKSGTYEIWVLCGNIPLNNGQPYSMAVSPGMVDTSLSRVVEFVSRVMRLVENGIAVQLVDSFINPIPYKEAKLSFTFDPANASSFMRMNFVDEADGMYTGYYLARDLGTYNICVSFEDLHLHPCPFEVNVYNRDYFPEAYNDSISVWEDGSVAFDVLRNDYYAGGNASIISSSIPVHGSLLRYGEFFRYTPYKGFSGNDSFSYTISDANNNIAVGTVILSVLRLPPQFVSLPVHLQVTEDIISPKFGGFPGFSIKYSDVLENISVTLRAQSGTILLAPMPLQLWQPWGSKLSVSKGGIDGKDVKLAGNVEVINSVLQMIQYIGDENFYGNDILSLYAMNKNGMQDAHVPIFVEPVNDPPFIHVPKFVIFDKEVEEGMQIFNKQRDMFEFSIGDQDILSFPGNKSHFIITLTMEVNAGMLISSLPVDLLRTVELKIKGSYHWEHLQSFVTISNHFIVKGKGVRIRGTIEECNTAMEKLLYKGVEQGAVLTVNVNDMGNYGTDPDGAGQASLPISTEVTVNLIRRRPISSMTAHFLGSAIIIEFILMLVLGGMLLFFICKCTNSLKREMRSSSTREVKGVKGGSSEIEDQTPSGMAYYTGRSGSIGRQISNFRQGSFSRVSGNQESSKQNHQLCSPSSIKTFSIEKPNMHDRIFART